MTVGTEEGWTPGTFVSSRDRERGKKAQKVQRPEDFMDEDDDLAMGRRLAARTGFAGKCKLDGMPPDITEVKACHNPEFRLSCELLCSFVPTNCLVLHLCI